MLNANVKVGDRVCDPKYGWGTVKMVSPNKIYCIVNWDSDPACFDQVPIEDNEVADEYMYGRC